MESAAASENWSCLSISELLRRYPCTVPVFFRHRMACVGCAVADFHTLAQAAALYRADLAQITSELERVIQEKPSAEISAPMENTK